MPLPTISVPTYTLILPSTKKPINYRPFLVREEKLLLMAKESQNITSILSTIRQVIGACILDSNVKIEMLTGFDLEYFFLKLRAVSVNNVVELVFIDKEDNKSYSFDVDLNEIEITNNLKHNNKIKIDDQLTLELRYPPTIFSNEVVGAQTETEALFAIIKGTLSRLYNSEEIWEFDSFTDKEITEFLHGLPPIAYDQIKVFLETMPALRHEINYKNSLGHDRKIVLQSLSDFFTLG